MKKLGELLVEREWLTRDQLTQALRHQQVFGGRLGTCLLELTLLSEERLTKALSDQLGVPAVTQDDLRVIADNLTEQVPAKLACRIRAIPFERFGNALSVAIADVRDLQAQDELAFVTSKRLKVHVAPEVRILEALEKHYNCHAEPRYSRIWDRLNRAKYLWQEETPAAGTRRRPEATPTTEPMRPYSGPEWQPSPPPPLESGVHTMAAAAARTAAAAAPQAAAAPAPVVQAPPALVVQAPPEPAAPAAAPAKRRWFSRAPKDVPAPAPVPAAVAPPPAAPQVAVAPPPAPVAAAPVAPPTPAPVAAAPVPRPVATAAAQPPVAAPPVQPPPRAQAPAPPRSAAPRAVAAPVRTAPPAAASPRSTPAAPAAPAAPGPESDTDTLPPAPTPTPLVQAAPEPPTPAPAAAAEQESSDTSPLLVPKPVATVADFEARMGEVEERDDVAHAALSFLSRRFQRSLLFMIRGNVVAAWMGGGEGVDQRLFGEIEVSFDEPSLFLNLREGSPFYRGPLPRLDAHQRLVRAWGGKYPKECLLLPVRIKKRLVAAVYCDGGHDQLADFDLGQLQQVAALMGRGLESFLAKRKRG